MKKGFFFLTKDVDELQLIESIQDENTTCVMIDKDIDHFTFMDCNEKTNKVILKIKGGDMIWALMSLVTDGVLVNQREKSAYIINPVIYVFCGKVPRKTLQALSFKRRFHFLKDAQAKQKQS